MPKALPGDVIILGGRQVKMASAVQQNVENWKAKLDKVLHEKNGFTDLLEKVEQKTGVRRLYLAIGNVN